MSASSAPFLRLSRILTGVEHLDTQQADTYLAFVSGRAELTDTLTKLIAAFIGLETRGGDLDELVRRQLVEDATFGPLCGHLIVLWYTASYSPDPKTTIVEGPGSYFGALLWPAVHAHVPGLSGGYLGYWAYPPEN